MKTSVAPASNNVSCPVTLSKNAAILSQLLDKVKTLFLP